VAADFDRERVSSEGFFKRFQRSSDAGRRMDFAFCPECGSTVFWDIELRPESIGVAVGAFADAGFPAPHVAFWTAHQHHWVTLPESIPHRP
jgi:hypothetical protein